MDPREIAPQEFSRTVLYHCGRKMRTVSSKVEDQIRTRYHLCDACKLTTKTTESIPQGRAANIARDERRH